MTEISCTVNKPIQSTSHAASGSDSITATDIFSARTKIFLKDFHLQPGNGNQPDARFVEKYSLMKIGEYYYVGMILKFSSEPDPAALIRLHVITGSRAAGLLSIKIPIQSVEKLSGIDGILQADIDTKVNLK